MYKKNNLLIFIALILFILTLLTSSYFWGWSIDDPWITYRYVQNLTNGNGLVFNIGERLESYTSLTMILILSLYKLIGFEPDLPCRIIGILSSSLIPLLMLIFSTMFFNKQPIIILILGALLYAINPSAALWAVGGLETSLYALLMLGILFLFLREEEKIFIKDVGQENSPQTSDKAIPIIRWSFLLMFITSLTRIEGPLTFIAIICYIILKCILNKKLYLKEYITGILLFIIPYSIYTFWRWSYFGDLLPNTFYAKVTGPKKEQFISGLKYCYNFFNTNGGYVYILLVFYLVLTLILIIKRISASYNNNVILDKQKIKNGDSLNNIERFRLVLFMILFYNLFFIIYSGGDWMPLYRFFVHFLPILLLGIQDSVFIIYEIFNANPINKKFRKIIFSLLIIIFVFSIGTQTLLNYQNTYEIVERTKMGTYHQQYFEVGNFLKHSALPDSVLAAEEAGIIPYVSRLRFIDIMGLVDKHIARTKGKMHWKSDPDYVISRKPDYILIHATIDSNEGNWRGIYPTGHDLLNNPKFHEQYHLLKTFIRGDDKFGKNKMCLFKKNSLS